jgi:hypothetical protein
MDQRNVRPKTMKLIEDNTGETPEDVIWQRLFCGVTLQA